MKILDLDLDCFIEGITHLSSDDDNRLDDQEYPPWNETDFRSFLENQCGLRKSQPIKGKVVKEHLEAFQLWHKMVDDGSLTVPFEVTHVDAHSDMGYREKGCLHILHELLFLPLDRRISSGEDPKYLSSGSFLAYALALRWISKLTFVHHLDYLENDDFVGFWFKDFNPDSGIIELKGYYDSVLSDYMDLEPPVREPEIPCTLISVEDFSFNGRFNIATISQSPGFTPRKADTLLEIFREYIIDEWS